VLTASADSITREKQAGQGNEKTETASGAKSSEPQGQKLVYAARISVSETHMRIENRLVDLAPGMAATVEIKTGGRRIIELLLSPLLRYKQESLRER
jgi:hemolysin D